ncbi:hypothetical protein GCM10027194_06340 [Thalassiella azotivora]
MVDGVATGWFAAPSLVTAAELAGRVAALSAVAAVDVRPTGARVRVDAGAHAEAVSGAARDLGLIGDPAVPQQLDVVVESPDPAALRRFWQPVLDYVPGPDGALQDPLQRDPALRIRPSTEALPLRSRIHLDVVRPAEAVEASAPGEPAGPYGVRHTDPDGNEVDLVPGSPLGEADGTRDWQVVFSAVACYRTASVQQQRDLAAAAARLADEAGFPLLLDLRPGLVLLDSGKDQWERDAHGLEVDFEALAAALQTAARGLGATADAGRARFTQVVLDAVDVAAVRAFWVAALGYVPDRRDHVTDVHDPRRLGPVVVLQDLDAFETDRRRQRNRIHCELAVPPDAARARVASALAAGGRLLDEAAGRWLVTDPEGNELVVVGAP